MAKDKKMVQAITSMEDDFAQWYTDVVLKAELTDYKEKIQRACEEFEDAILAPSIAVGYVVRTNVEEDFRKLFSEAEYEMLEDKFKVKGTAGYQERMRKGLNMKKV